VIDADYFRNHFPTYVREYAQHRGLQQNTEDLVVAAVLDRGEVFPFIGWRAGDEWIVLFSEDDVMRTVPYEAIRDVFVRRRPEPLPGPPPPPPVGFQVVSDEA
jgi:hypothetical protein